MLIHEKTHVEKKWTVRKYASEAARLAGEAPYEVVEDTKNVLLNEGIQLLLDLLIGAGGTAYDNTNAYLGVGDDATAESATQTGLLAASNLLYNGMEAGYPQRAAQTVTWRAVFADAEANFAWNEVSLSNASGGNTGTNLNRRVPGNLGTKASGSWTLDLEITIS